jgi:hypothetical protein
VPKKPVFIRLPFKGDHLLTHTSHRLRSAIKRTYNAANLHVLVDTQSLPLPSLQKTCSILDCSHCLYKFECSCGAFYLGRTDRKLQVRMNEHIPKWLVKRMSEPAAASNPCQRNPLSSIARHLMTTGHIVDLNSCFSVIHRYQNSSILRIIESLLICRLNPPLCIQKLMMISLKLPWT